MSQPWYEAASVRILHRTITHTGIREKGVNVSMRRIRCDTASSIFALDFAFLFNLHLRVFTLCDHFHVLVHVSAGVGKPSLPAPGRGGNYTLSYIYNMLYTML